MARRASQLAIEARRKERPADKVSQKNSAILLYTDCPCTSWFMATNDDMPQVCGASQIEATCLVVGPDFPQDAHEAERDDPDMPRIAAMWFPAQGQLCPRCNITHKELHEAGCCARCAAVVGA